MIRGIFFDLYGTLYLYGDMKQAWSVWLETFYSCMRDIGLSISKNEFSKECDRFFGREEPKKLDDEMSLFENRIIDFVENYQLATSKNGIRKIAEIVVNSWQDFIDIDPDTKFVLETLKRNFIIGLVSNFDHPIHVRKSLKENQLESLFDSIVISAEVGVKKPDPKIFNRAFHETRLAPNEVIYVGDTADDMTAAAAAGMKSVLIKRNIRGTDEGALDFSISTNSDKALLRTNAHTISELKDIIPLVKEMNMI
ncbi:MAG: HAD family hydrolase [Ignavibacteriales bacterium]|nr:HAD family hydrolase [Ignavibacteriales bacterium]